MKKDVREMTAEELETFHVDAENRIATFKYQHPQLNKVKHVVMLSKSSRIMGLVQIVKDGGENNLHYHTNSDTIWMVLRGGARFYGVGNKVIGELGPHEGILMPGGARYWFEKMGDDDLELLQMVGYAGPADQDRRINLEKHKDWMEDVKEVDMKVY